MTSLAPLHARLTALLCRRRLAQIATVSGAVALVAIVSLWVWFIVDWACEWGRAPRILGLLFAAAAVVLARRRLMRTFARRETETDIALWVERHQRLDNDLVAALQFEPVSAAAWGSRQLELAIVDYVAHFSVTLWVAPKWPPRRVVAGGLLLILVAFASAVGMATHPRHAAAFVDRLLLGTSHYPRRTGIAIVEINGWELSAESNMKKCALGEDVRFMVQCVGELPASGRIVLTASSGETTTTELVCGDFVRNVPARSTEFISSSSGGDGTRRVPSTMGAYVARLPRLVESLECEICVGDAVTKQAHLVAVRSAVLSLSLRPSLPDYAASDDSRASVEPGSTQISVVEGSRVDLEIICENKALQKATLQLGQRTFKLRPADGSRRRWRLSVVGTPLERVTETLPFAVRATDVDGLELPEPLSGMIGLSLDHPPHVTATAVTQDLLPTARPTIHYSARDDYGLAGLWMRRELLRPEEPAGEELLEIPLVPSHAKAIQGTLTLELEALKLVKGDQLRITFEATDFRTPGEGRRASSEPLLLRVTDARGVLAAMTEGGERSTGSGSSGNPSTGDHSMGDFERIIEQQLGAEGPP